MNYNKSATALAEIVKKQKEEYATSFDAWTDALLSSQFRATIAENLGYRDLAESLRATQKPQ